MDFYGDNHYLWMIVLQGKSGKEYVTETSIKEIGDMITNRRIVRGIVAGQPSKRLDKKMEEDVEARRYIGFTYNKQFYVGRLNTFVHIDNSESMVGSRGSIGYRFEVEGELRVYNNRREFIDEIDWTCRSTSGVLKLHKKGTAESRRKARNIIEKNNKENEKAREYIN